MTDLLSRTPSRDVPPPAPSRAGPEPTWSWLRSSPSRAVAAALVAAGSALVVLWIVALAGWYGSDGGGHGTTTSALRVGTDAWLLAHASGLATRNATVTAVPLGLTLLCGLLCYRSARWAGGAEVDDLRGAGHCTVVFSGVYAVTAMTAALLASVPGAGPGPVRAFAGALVLGAAAGGAGLVAGAGLRGRLRTWLPVPVRATAYGGLVTVLATCACAAVVVVAALAWHVGTAARVVDRLGGGVSGALLSILVSVLLLPNAVALTASWLLGPGFAVGAGTVVSPSAVALGPVPAVPLLAALPATGTPSHWLGTVLVLPLLAGGWGAWRAGRRLPTRSWVQGALRGLGSGALAAVGLTVLVAAGGGAVGPGRMADLGAPLGQVLVLALAAFTAGGAVGGPAATWWARRHEVEDAERLERPALGPALVEVRGSVRSSTVEWLWSSRPWSRPWREQYTLGEQFPEDDDRPVRLVHLADEATVTVHRPDDPPPLGGEEDRRR
jgi:Family of unknown function (DUF6350)